MPPAATFSPEQAAATRHCSGAYDGALELTTNAVERAFLVRQRAAL